MKQNRWNIIFIATLFNLLFEYSLRGINNLFAQPLLPFILFAIYFTLFTMVEDVIVRYKLKDYHLILLAFFYGTIYNAYTSGILFIKPVFFGIDVYSLVLINIIWWGVVQAVITFYLANFLVPRNWNHPQLSKKGWLICVTINILAVLLFQVSGKIPHGTPLGNITVLSIAAGSLVLLLLTLKTSRPKTSSFQKNKVFTILTFTTVLIFTFCAIFLTHDPVLSNTSQVNASSLAIISRYTVILAVVLIVYRFISKKEISV